MKLQKFSRYIEEADAKDYVAPKDDDKEATEYKPRSKGEEKFAKDHKVSKSDAEPKGQEHIFKGSLKAVSEDIDCPICNDGENTCTCGESQEEKKNFNEGVLDTLRKIVKDKQASKVKFKNGKMRNIDMQTANMITKSYDKRISKPELKKKVEKMIDGSPEGLMKVLDIMYKG